MYLDMYLVFFLFSFRETEFELTASVAFTLFSVFTALQFSVATLPIAIRSLTEAKVSYDRLKNFLLLPEYQRNDYIENDDNEFDIIFQDYNAAHEYDKNDGTTNTAKVKKSDNATSEAEIQKEPLVKDIDHVQILFNLNLKVQSGKLIGVAGAVGSGKTSLISAITGELKTLSGKSWVSDKFVVAPQQSWIYSGSVRENILFGSCYDESVFNEVIEACALKQDLENWPQADLSEVGERGLTLSGGQKQRISLARALYAVLDGQQIEHTKANP